MPYFKGLVGLACVLLAAQVEAFPRPSDPLPNGVSQDTPVPIPDSMAQVELPASVGNEPPASTAAVDHNVTLDKASAEPEPEKQALQDQAVSVAPLPASVGNEPPASASQLDSNVTVDKAGYDAPDNYAADELKNTSSEPAKPAEDEHSVSLLNVEPASQPEMGLDEANQSGSAAPVATVAESASVATGEDETAAISQVPHSNLLPFSFPSDGSRDNFVAGSRSETQKRKVRVKKVKYGPIKVAPMSKNDGMTDTMLREIIMPCQECLILKMTPNLENLDGVTANANNGHWLHHVVLENNSRGSAVCPDRPERFFASGNERTVIEFQSAAALYTGYRIDDGDNISLIAELMNETNKEASVVITIEYEYIPFNHIRDQAQLVTPVWLDIGDVDGTCTRSKVPNIPNASFEMPSRPWKSTIGGEIVFAGGHIHDGGVAVNLFNNDQLMCSSKAVYGDDPAFREPEGMGMGMGRHGGHQHDHGMAGMAGMAGMNDHMDMGQMTEAKLDSGFFQIKTAENSKNPHITHMVTCHNFGPLQAGQVLSVKASYDNANHLPMIRMDQSLEPIMGIVLLYVASEPDDIDNLLAEVRGNDDDFIRSAQII